MKSIWQLRDIEGRVAAAYLPADDKIGTDLRAQIAGEISTYARKEHPFVIPYTGGIALLGAFNKALNEESADYPEILPVGLTDEMIIELSNARDVLHRAFDPQGEFTF